MPQASERSLATPITKPRLPVISALSLLMRGSEMRAPSEPPRLYSCRPSYTKRLIAANRGGCCNNLLISEEGSWRACWRRLASFVDCAPANHVSLMLIEDIADSEPLAPFQRWLSPAGN